MSGERVLFGGLLLLKGPRQLSTLESHRPVIATVSST